LATLISDLQRDLNCIAIQLNPREGEELVDAGKEELNVKTSMFGCDDIQTFNVNKSDDTNVEHTEVGIAQSCWSDSNKVNVTSQNDDVRLPAIMSVSEQRQLSSTSLIPRTAMTVLSQSRQKHDTNIKQQDVGGCTKMFPACTKSNVCIPERVHRQYVYGSSIPTLHLCQRSCGCRNSNPHSNNNNAVYPGVSSWSRNTPQVPPIKRPIWY